MAALDVPWRPTGRSGYPVLVQSVRRATLIFELGAEAAAPKSDAGGRLAALRVNVGPRPERPTQGPARAELRFEDCLVSSFGYPSDRERAGHPLHDYGLTSVGLFEVANSTWTQRLAERHGVARPGDQWPPRPLRHFVAAFNQVTFECLCGDLLGRATDASVATIVAALTE